MGLNPTGPLGRRITRRRAIAALVAAIRADILCKYCGGDSCQNRER